ncbi:hypothetical protein O3P69_018703 [Scylla paramamosain]|uniref:Uncharacterized protein n=1 Tax=Scylla paramamosain TaxID=85552 RepID=A0AAW0SSH4_SCYPA
MFGGGPSVLVTHERATITPGRSLGTQNSVQVTEDSLAQFEMIAQGQGWSAEDKALQLVASLCGPELEILAHLTAEQRSSYKKVEEALKRRFGSIFQSLVYRERLKGRARQSGFAEQVKGPVAGPVVNEEGLGLRCRASKEGGNGSVTTSARAHEKAVNSGSSGTGSDADEVERALPSHLVDSGGKCRQADSWSDVE